MKRPFVLTLAALAALLAASCQKEEEGRVLTATIEQYEHNSKAYINDDHYACWEDGDLVNINGTSYPISLSTGGQANTATIEGTENLSGSLMAYYPADGVTDMSSAGGTVKLPHIQNYEELNGHQIINNPMAACCTDGSQDLRFRNLCALLKVTIVGSTSVKAIQVKGIDNQMLWGEAQLTLNDRGLPTLTSFTKGSNSVTLQIPRGVTPSSNTFYIVVPAKSDFEHLTIAVLANDGSNYTHNSKTSFLGESLSRNQIGAISYTPAGDEADTFTPDWIMRYTATQQVAPNANSNFGNATCQSNVSIFSAGNGCLIFDRPVTTIGNSAFQNCSTLTSITLPEILAEIGDYAFQNCSTLTSITLPEILAVIGDYAFQNCNALDSITLPESLTEIGNYAFRNCGALASITWPKGLTTVEEGVFCNCLHLRSVTLPEDLTRIGDSAFYWCYNLKDITWPSTLTEIADEAFDGCFDLIIDNLPSRLTKIGNSAFSLCKLPYSFTLPEGLTEIGESAFMGCDELERLTLPQSLISIGRMAFADCENLLRVEVHRWEPDNPGHEITQGGLLMFGDEHCIILVQSGAENAYKSDQNWCYYADRIHGY